ncbi:hypothetical protein NLJ89_g5547 [Agrocybe chaxingu]|uniref:Uncharacterized protein n=1 Tax=Agrocybe chaxingu TaxID=84603 RepID=A0A9W8MWU6_9AGAR|nr:hypothetical protein NLJ89_g5547 [Agrocybe chaxingu]
MSAPNDTKSPQGPAQAPNASGAQSSQQPPTYNPYYSQQYPQVQPYPVVQEQTLLVYRPSTTRRFLRALAFAVFTWVLLGIFTRTFVDMVHWHHKHHHHHREGDDWPPIRFPPDIELDQCVSKTGWRESDESWSSFPYSAETSFDLPVDATTLSLFAHGPWPAGKVTIVTSPDQQEDVVTYRIIVHYHREFVRDKAEVCSFTREGDENGVAIFMPQWPYPRRKREDFLFFETFVILPESRDDGRLSISNFVTTVPYFSHTIGDLFSKVLFDKISLHGSNMPIEVASLAATVGAFQTSNGPIKGIFNTTRSLKLITSNSPIDAHVGLIDDKDGSSPELVADTSNARLDLAISLLTESESGTGGEYTVDGHTNNSPVRISFPTAPVNSTLVLTGTTSNSPATVELHPTYEGTVSLSTSSWFAAELRWDGDVEDPSGDGRRRLVDESNRRRGVFEGAIHWVDGSGRKRDPATDGKVTVHSSNSPVRVHV